MAAAGYSAGDIGRMASYRLTAQSDCSSDPQDREIQYALTTTSGGSPSQQFYVVQHESNPSRAGNTNFGPQTSYDENNGFDDQMSVGVGMAPNNSIQTFFISPMSEAQSPAFLVPVLARDSSGNDYSALGVWMSSDQIFVNGKLAPSMAPCK